MIRILLLALVLLAGCSLSKDGAGPDPDGESIEVFSDPVADMSDSKTRRAMVDDEPRKLSIAPDPLAAAPPKRSSAGGQPKHYIFAYGGGGNHPETGQPWCLAYLYDKPKLTGWANARGITVSEANAPNARYAVLQFVDFFRDKPRRDLQFNPPDPAMYPTYLIVTASGQEKWHHVGPLDMSEFDFVWQLLEAE